MGREYDCDDVMQGSNNREEIIRASANSNEAKSAVQRSVIIKMNKIFVSRQEKNKLGIKNHLSHTHNV